jgi:hypothetical protein
VQQRLEVVVAPERLEEMLPQALVELAAQETCLQFLVLQYTMLVVAVALGLPVVLLVDHM